MRFKVNFTIWDYDDYYIIEWETIEEIREIAISEQNKRGLNNGTNNLWSERLD